MGARRGAKIGARPPPPGGKKNFPCGGLPIFSLLWAFFFLLGPCNPCREPFFSLWGAFFVLVPPPFTKVSAGTHGIRLGDTAT